MSKESIEQRARELLAECARKIGQPEYAYHVGCGGDLDLEDQALIETLMVALTPQWQPIESAPKGQEVLVWRTDQGVFIAMIATPDMVMSESDIEECCLPEDFEEWYCEAWGWLEDDLRPTRWMPKPAEPEAV